MSALTARKIVGYCGDFSSLRRSLQVLMYRHHRSLHSVELWRCGSKGIRHIPADQCLVLEVGDVRDCIRLLKNIERDAVALGLLDGGANA